MVVSILNAKHVREYLMQHDQTICASGIWQCHDIKYVHKHIEKRISASGHIPLPPSSSPFLSRLEQPWFVGEGPIVDEFPKMSYHRLVDVSSVGVDLVNDVHVSKTNGEGERAYLKLRHVPILDLCIGWIIGPRKIYPFD